MCFFGDLRFLMNSLIDTIYEREMLMNKKCYFPYF